MGRITTKFRCGDKVQVGSTPGMITAIIVRGKGRSYEFSYENDTGPTCINAQDFEIALLDDDKKLGFTK